MTDMQEYIVITEEEPLDYTVYDEVPVTSASGRNDGLAVLILGPSPRVVPALPPFRISDVVILLLLFFRLPKAYQLYRGFVFSPHITLFSSWMFVLIFTILLSTVMNILAGRRGFFYKDFFVPIVFFRMIIIAAIMASFSLREKQIKQFHTGIMMIILVITILAFAQRFRIFGLGARWEYFYPASIVMQKQIYRSSAVVTRISGTFGNSNHFAGCIVMLATVPLAFAINVKGLRKVVSLMIYGWIGVVLMTTTGSRTAIFGFALVSGLSFVLSLRRGSRLPTIIFLMAIMTVVLFLRSNIYYLPVSDRIKDVIAGREGAVEEGLLSRYRMWQHSFEVATESILFGVGVSKLEQQLTDNGYIYTLMRIGVFGLFAYVLMLVALFIRGMKSLYLEHVQLNRAAMLAFIMVLVNTALFEMTGEFLWGVRYGAIFAAFMGLLCGFSRQIQEEQSSSYQIIDAPYDSYYTEYT
jgi:hypothetical protein